MGLFEIAQPLFTALRKGHQLISATSREKILGTLRIEPVAAGLEVRMLSICAMQPLYS